MSDNDEEVEDKLQVYTLVRFVHRGRKKQVESIDIVPSKWLDFDSQRGRCVTKYMQPPYGEEDLKLIQTLTMNNVDAPEDWPVFSVELSGRAETYDEALKKLKRLECEDHVLTLESEDSASEIRKQLTTDVKRKKLLAEAIKLKAKVSMMSTNTDDPQSLKVNENKSDMKKDDNTEAIEVVKSFPAFSEFQPSTSKGILNFSESQPSTSKAEPNQEDFSGLEHSVITVEPIVHFTDVVCNSDFERNVLTLLLQMSNDLTLMQDRQDEMAKEISSMKETQESISTFLIDKKVTKKSSTELGIKYQITIPIPTFEDFILFDDKLKSDKYFKNDVYLELRTQIDKDWVLTKSIVRMLKKFMTKEVASMFTAIRSSAVNKNKHKFKPTEFCALIYGTIIKVRTEKFLLTETEQLNTALTDVLSNVYKWK